MSFNVYRTRSEEKKNRKHPATWKKKSQTKIMFLSLKMAKNEKIEIFVCFWCHIWIPQIENHKCTKIWSCRFSRTNFIEENMKFCIRVWIKEMTNFLSYIFGTVGSRAPQFIKSSYITVVYKWFKACLSGRQKI